MKGSKNWKIDYGPGYRVYFGQEGNDFVILLCGGDKSTQNEDIKEAKQYWASYKRKKLCRLLITKSTFEDLKNLDYAAGYLTAALEEGEDVFLLAVRDVVQAQGGMSALSQATKLNRGKYL